MKVDLCKLLGVEEGEEFKFEGYEYTYNIKNSLLYILNEDRYAHLEVNDLVNKEIIKLPKKKEFTDDELCILRNIKSEINTLGRNINGTIYVLSDYGKSYLKLFNNLFQSLDIGEEIIIDDYVER